MDIFREIMKEVKEEEFFISFNSEFKDTVEAYFEIGRKHALYVKSPIRATMLKAHIAKILTFTNALEELAQVTEKAGKEKAHAIIDKNHKSFCFTSFVRWPRPIPPIEFIGKTSFTSVASLYSPLTTKQIALEEILVLQPQNRHNEVKICEPYNLILYTIMGTCLPIEDALKVCLSCWKAMGEATDLIKGLCDTIRPEKG